MASLKGTIIKGIAGFYYVATVESGIYACRARGIFRKDNQKPLVGDRVEIEVTDEQDKEANVVRILPRKNALIRPAVANVDQAMLLFALRSPDPDGTLLDRFLLLMETQQVPVLICFNKTDLAGDAEAARWREIYESCGYDVHLISAGLEQGTEELKACLQGKTTVVAGPSGAGKSTLTNLMQTAVHMETGELSEKLGRGKNTTRHAELVPLDGDTFFCDTPGFTSLDLPGIEAADRDQYFPEFAPYREQCRFPDCAHMQEPDCAVRDAVDEDKISRERYEHYRRFYEELKDREKNRW